MSDKKSRLVRTEYAGGLVVTILSRNSNQVKRFRGIRTFREAISVATI
jgi:hypothetical protein